MIKMMVAEKLGGLNCEIQNDLETVIFENGMKGEISYANKRAGSVIINYIKLNKRYKGADGFKFTEEQEKIIKDFINAKYDIFVSELLAKKHMIKIHIAGSDFPHAVLAIEDIDFDLYYQYLEEEKHILDAFKWIETELQKEGLDVTERVIQKLKEKEIIKMNAEQRINAIFAKAKETGTEQLLSSWSEDCNDEDEECGCDNMYEYAMPDGSRKKQRVHTY